MVVDSLNKSPALIDELASTSEFHDASNVFSAALITPRVAKAVPNDETWTEERFRQMLGRELTPEERKYLGLSAAVLTLTEFEFHDRFRHREAELQSPIRRRK